MGGVCRVPRAVLLSLGEFCCHLPSGTLRGACVNNVFPEFNHLGVALVVWTCRLTFKASPRMFCPKILKKVISFLPQKRQFHGNIALGWVIASSAQLC